MSVEREMSLVEWCTKLPMHHAVNRELVALNNKLAALAEQNKKLKECLSHYAVYQTAYGTKNAAAKLLEELK